MSNAEYIRSLMLTCPFITVSPLDMHIDQIAPEPLNYSIESIPSDPVLKKYLNGDTIRSFPFALTARRNFIMEEDREANSGSYEKVALWMEDLSRKRKLPPMDAGQTPQKLQATGCTYVAETADDGDSAIYVMQAQLIFYQKARI